MPSPSAASPFSRNDFPGLMFRGTLEVRNLYRISIIHMLVLY